MAVPPLDVSSGVWQEAAAHESNVLLRWIWTCHAERRAAGEGVGRGGMLLGTGGGTNLRVPGTAGANGNSSLGVKEKPVTPAGSADTGVDKWSLWGWWYLPTVVVQPEDTTAN